MEWHSKCLSYLFIRSKCRRYDEEIKIRGVHGSDWFSLRRLRSNQIILVTHFVNSSKIKLILFGLFWILLYRKKKFFLLLVNISHRQNWVGSIRMYPLVHPFVMAYGADLRLFPAPTCKLTAQGKWNLFALNIMANRQIKFGYLWFAVSKFIKSCAFFFGHRVLFTDACNLIIYFSISYTLMLRLGTLLATTSLASEREFEYSSFMPSNLRFYSLVILETNHLTFLIPNHKDVWAHLVCQQG